MTDTIQHRSEILFLYDVSEANPNGDPLELNRPRTDPDTGHNLVTDVRLKRTVRDYLIYERGYDGSEQSRDVFVREIPMPDGKGIQDGKTRATQFGKGEAEVRANVTARCIDVRLFGATIPLPDSSVTLTGPVQFRLARSLNRVEVFHVKGTGAFAAEAGKKQATFREEDFVHYSLIPFYGAINPKAAEDSRMTEADANLLTEALWLGTKHLHSRSKLGHMPRLLIKINYGDKSSFVGELHRRIKLKLREGLVDEKDIRSVEDYSLAIDPLVAALKQAMNGEGQFGARLSIDSVEVAWDPALPLTFSDKPVTDLVAKLNTELNVEVRAILLAQLPSGQEGEAL
jgi:CRISPR-associated protein Csh2